MAQPTQCCT